MVSFRRCHGIVTSDVLVLGLSRGAIAARKLKGQEVQRGGAAAAKTIYGG